MTRFVCVTQHASIQTHNGPSGQSYTSLRGVPFEVDDKRDVDHFKSSYRFEEFTIKKALQQKITKKPVIPEEDDKKLEEFLAVANISKKSKESLKKLYGKLEDLYSEHMAGGEFPDIPKRHADKVKRLLERQAEQEEM